VKRIEIYILWVQTQIFRFMLKGTLVNYVSEGVQVRKNLFSLAVRMQEGLNIA
jgi:hypothetical protein